MKKIISVVLVMIMSLSLTLPAFAASGDSYLPIVYVEGQGDYIYADKDDPNSEVLNRQVIPDGMIDTIVEQLTEPLIKGALKRDYSEYCDALYNWFAPYYERMALDENGEVSNGTGNDCIQEIPTDDRSRNGMYKINSYNMTYDFRLDPLVLADQLNEYIEAIKTATGHSQVNIISRCLGVNIVLAYFYKYGTASVNKCVMYATGFDGFDVCGALFSGSVVALPDAVDRYVQSNLADDDGVQQLIKAVVTMTNKLKTLGFAIDEIYDIYEAVYQNVIPRLMKVCHGSFPSYWSMVNDEYYEKAKQLNFGGQEEKYAEFIRKIDNYHYNVYQNQEQMLRNAMANGMELYIVAKYNTAMLPVASTSELQSDGDVNTSSSSYGATITDIDKTLSDKYIEDAIANGKGAYISSDKKIDASTCFLPDHTWFIKDLHHDYMPYDVDARLFGTMFKHNGYMTVWDYEELPQYLYWDGGRISPLTDQNSGGRPEWNKSFLESFRYFMLKILNYLNDLLQRISDKLSGNK